MPSAPACPASRSKARVRLYPAEKPDAVRAIGGGTDEEGTKDRNASRHVNHKASRLPVGVCTVNGAASPAVPLDAVSAAAEWPAEGLFVGPAYHFALRAYFDDTDAGGVVYHANYLRWFERSRSAMLRALGLDQPRALAEGWGAYAVTEIGIRYLRPARLGDPVLITTRMTELRAASWRVEQQALCGDSVLADAQIRIGFVTPEGRPARHPAGWYDTLQTVLAPEGAA